MTETDAKVWAQLLRTEANSLRHTCTALMRLADQLDPPGDLPEPNRSSHSS